MKKLHIDIETYSDVDLTKSGVYKYAESDAFEILLYAYSEDDSPATVIDLTAGETIPAHILSALSDPAVEKWAYNANFERVCLSRYLGMPTGTYLSPEGWRCSMVLASVVGLPPSLAKVSEVMKLEKSKMAEGEALIRYFCVPCKATAANGGRTRNMPQDAPERWELFKSYNARDVEAELEIHSRIQKFDTSSALWEEYELDQTINDRGVAVYEPLICSAIEMDTQYSQDVLPRMQALTGLANPRSTSQLQKWLQSQDVSLPNLQRKTVVDYVESAPAGIVRDALQLRLDTAKSSIRKYEAMQATKCSDQCIRGLFRFYGTHTGRWSGRLVQVQNLPQNHLDDLDDVRTMVLSGDRAALSQLSVSVPEVLSQLIRTAFVAHDGCHFIVSDFSAIEARVLATLAKETWRMRAFENGEDIYCASASKMFGVPVEKNGVNGHLRAKGKIAELALGYNGSVGALRNMGALDYGLDESDLQPLVDAWRKANPNITRLWADFDRASVDVVTYGGFIDTHGIRFECVDRMLYITLPSGRQLYYIDPRIGVNRFDMQCVTFCGWNSETNKRERRETYGGRLTENIVQAIARDLLAYAMIQLRDYSIVMHIHDEVVIEAPLSVTPDMISQIMCRTPPWAEGLCLSAEAFAAPYYQKD